jgi:tetratricopeptide (TPR) repeat protein
VLRELALVTDENDRAIAREYLERYLAAEAPDRITAEARVRLGRWYARERRWSQAILQLRLALGGRPPDPRIAVFGRILLAEAYMQTGRLAEAIDLLRGSLSSTAQHIYPPDYATPFALAVAYDRDEQITLAHETLERLAGLAPDALSLVLADHHGQKTPLVPLEERHYFAALQYEVLGHLAESRAEWLAYLRWKDAPYRERARQHLVEVEKMLRAETASRARPPAPTPSPFPPLPLGVP